MSEETKNKKSWGKNFLIIFTTFILTVLLTLGLLGFYIFKANPFNVQACIVSSFLTSTGSGDSEIEAGQESTEGAGIQNEEDKHPLLNTEQEKQLEDAGINVESLPQTISPETEKCFIEKLGKERVEEIKAGEAPTTWEIFKARGCL